MKDIIALIPARSGSKGVPNKNIMLFNDIPLIAYSIAAAKKSKLIDRVIVSTDSQEYAEIALKYGAEVPFIRPKNISCDTSTDLHFFYHALDWLKNNELFVPKFIAHLRPTTPIRDPQIIDKALSSFIESEFSALRSCHEMTESSYKTFEIEDMKLKSICSGTFDIEISNNIRQSFEKTFEANGYIDIVRSDLIINHDVIHGNNVNAFITDITYEVDSSNDVEIMEYFMKKKSKLIKSLFN
jgi:CMP-N,N'-diacetyllegionaminic acid synthase